MDDPGDATELVMSFQGSWDFPLSRAEKVRRVLEIYDREVDLAVRDADAQKRRADALEDANAVLRERAELPNQRYHRHTASFWTSSPPRGNTSSMRCTRQRITSVRWSWRGDSVEGLLFVRGGDLGALAEGGGAAGGEHDWALRPGEFVQMPAGASKMT